MFFLSVNYCSLCFLSFQQLFLNYSQKLYKVAVRVCSSFLENFLLFIVAVYLTVIVKIKCSNLLNSNIKFKPKKELTFF